MIIDMKNPDGFAEAMLWVKHYRTIYGRFVITLNGCVVAVLHFQRD